jgi:hypothetical protein
VRLKINSLAIRALLLFALALPAFTPLLTWITPILGSNVAPIFSLMAMHLAYGFLIWGVIAWMFGSNVLVRTFAFAAPLALIVVLTGALIGSIPLIGVFIQGGKSSASITEGYVKQFTQMMVFIPFALLAVMCFPAAEVIERASLRHGRPRKALVLLAVAVRIFQVIFDAIRSYLNAWREENPRLIWPRVRADIGSIHKWRSLPLWFVGASTTWAIALAIHTVDQIPPIVDQLDRLNSGGSDGDK